MTKLKRRQGSVDRKPKTVAYLRVSTDGQDLEKNKADILQLANSKDMGQVHFIEEKVSGKVSWKERKIKDIVDDLQKGTISSFLNCQDSVAQCWILWKFSRLQRTRKSTSMR